MTQMFGTAIPDNHIAMQSSDPQFSRNKDLIKALMTSTFLTKASASLDDENARGSPYAQS